ncbi:defect-in-organelle-trafficking protein DotB [Roseateles asaccharophilus]|uniref:type IV pilus twitching motility protein PilT n=1 Tax=Roseateles asaccharophilus TaxID=582607 RepID=UPI003833A399
MSDDYAALDEKYAFPDEPRSFQHQDFDNLLIHATDLEASDITWQTDEPVMAHIHGRNRRMTKRALNAHEVDNITKYIYGSNGVARIRGGEDIDCRHPIKTHGVGPNGTKIVRKLGFRVNITGCTTHGDDNGIQITCRTIRSLPPKLSDLGIEEDLVKALFPDSGMVAICGATGSGKSTLLAATIREILEDEDAHQKIITLEAPIEFTYDEVTRSSTIVSQHEIPRHLPTFARGVRNTLRRAPTIILVGETRDGETVNAALEAAMTGHTLYTTMHCDSVAQSLSRMANWFAPSERMTKIFEIIESLRVLVVQRLVKRVDGQGRVALREYLVFDQTVRDQLRMVQTPKEAVHVVSKLVESRGQTMLSAAQRAFDAGLISAELIASIEQASRSDLIEDLGLGVH